MNRDTLGQVMDQWTSDPSFRERMRQDPEATVRSAGVEVNDEDLVVLNSVDWNLSDEELQQRLSRIW